MSDNILYAVSERIATITFNRPKVMNALDAETIVRFREVCERAEQDAAALMGEFANGRPMVRALEDALGERVTRARYGVDDEICTGDHSCIRLSGCPSLTVKPSPDRK